jgi:NADH-quinone oxidoreductase subunit J
MVLILFVIMLLNLRPSDISVKQKAVSKAVFIIFTVMLMGASLIAIIYYGESGGGSGEITSAAISETGSVQIIARAMFSQYLLPFELVSLLITVAIIGVVILSRGGLPEKRDGGN